MEYKYGVREISGESYVEPISDNKVPEVDEYKYVCEYKTITESQANGYGHMSIFTKGELKVIKSGNWEIQPIVKMPFNWTGYSVEVTCKDINKCKVIKKASPSSSSIFKTTTFIPFIEWIVNYFDEVSQLKDQEHFEFMEEVLETKRIVGISKKVYIDEKTAKGKPQVNIPISSFTKEFKMLAKIIDDYDEQKVRLNDKENSFTQNKINEVIDMFNLFTMEKLK